MQVPVNKSTCIEKVVLNFNNYKMSDVQKINKKMNKKKKKRSKVPKMH